MAAARVGRFLAVGALLVGMCAAAGAQARGAAHYESAEEVNLAALGATDLNTAGYPCPPGPECSGAVTLAAAFPPPSGPLAVSGSFVRIFFSHSQPLDPGSASLTVAVNGEPLTTFWLSPSTAGGAVFEVRVPTVTLHLDRANVLDARFDLQSDSAGGAQLYARLNPQTVMHYQLFVPPGGEPPSRLEAYPFPLVRGGTPTHVGLVLPAAPTDADLSAALRLAADLGRRSAGQVPRPDVVTSGAEAWLRSGGVPALLVGPLSRLPLSEPVLRAAGFTKAASWWGPAGEPVGRDDGLLVRVPSPWEGDTPLVLVSGASDEAVARAAGLLVRGGPALPAGQYAIVRQPPPAAPTASPPAAGLDLGDAGEVRGPGLRVLASTVTAPPPDTTGFATLRLRLSHTALAAGSSLTVRLNGATVAVVPLDGTRRDVAVRLSVPGGALRAGRNAVTLAFRLAGAGGGAYVAPGADLVLPGRPSGAPLLAQAAALFDDPAGVLVALGGRDDGLLTAAAQALAELGARTTTVPALAAAAAGEARPGSGSLVAVRAAGELRPVTSGLPPATGQLGVLAVRPLTQSSPHWMLWIDGGSPELLQAAAAALDRPALPGSAVGVTAAGQIAAVAAPAASAAPAAPGPAPTLLAAVWALVAAAAVSIALVVGWRVVRPRDGRSAAGLTPSTPAAELAPAPGPPAAATPPPPAGPRALGLPQVEAELVRAAGEVGGLSLALLGVDGEGEGDAERMMSLLDEAVAGSLAPSDSVCEYGPTERLVLLRGVTAPALSVGAAQLCVGTADVVGRPVRAALATFPADGSTLRYLLDRLELGLASCRAAGRTVVWS